VTISPDGVRKLVVNTQLSVTQSDDRFVVDATIFPVRVCEHGTFTFSIDCFNVSFSKTLSVIQCDQYQIEILGNQALFKTAVVEMLFALKAEKKDQAIFCASSLSPTCSDIRIYDNCNANTDSWASHFGESYANDTGLDGRTFFTGSDNFTVKEIEVFEITD
jgi:hypothetical protein